MSPTVSAKLAKHGLVNWLKDYQEEDEHVTLKKALCLSKVRRLEVIFRNFHIVLLQRVLLRLMIQLMMRSCSPVIKHLESQRYYDIYLIPF